MHFALVAKPFTVSLLDIAFQAPKGSRLISPSSQLFFETEKSIFNLLVYTRNLDDFSIRIVRTFGDLEREI